MPDSLLDDVSSSEPYHEIKIPPAVNYLEFHLQEVGKRDIISPPPVSPPGPSISYRIKLNATNHTALMSPLV